MKRIALLIACAGILGTASAENFVPSAYLRLALRNSPEAISAHEAYLSASAQWKAALGDSWLPALSAQARANPYGNNPLHANLFNPWRLNGSDVDYSASASLNLFNSFLDWRKTRQSWFSREAARISWDLARQTRAFEALRAYLDLYLKQRLKEVADSDLAARKVQYELTLDLYKNGMKSKSDLLKSEADWRSSQLRVLSSEAERRKSLYHFNILIERKPDEQALLAELSPPATGQAAAEEAVSRAYAERPELRKNAVELRSAQTLADGALQKLFPTLSASANWSASKSATFGDSLLGTGRSHPNYFLALTLSLPVGFNALSQIEGRLAARSEVRRVGADREALRRRVREEVHFARIGLDQALESYQVGLERETIARQDLDLVTQQYRQGSADVIRMTQARQDYLQARNELSQLLNDTQLRWLEYRLSIGEPLWEE